MSSKVGGGREGERRGIFLSAHRCPKVDLLSHHDSDTQIPPPRSLVPADKRPEFICESEANYLDVSSTCCYEGREEEEEEEGCISDWSEEDLSLHFSPSVILPSDDEDSGPEIGFECVDVTVETQVNGHEGQGQKMVPKRQIHLKKKDGDNIIDQETTNKLQAMLKDRHIKEGGANSEVSACHYPPLLLRQHSTPASMMTSSDVIRSGVYRGLITGAHQVSGFQAGPSEEQRRLQKSFSLDETKTKMASCILKSVLLKKMQVEQKTSHLKKNLQVLPVSPPSVEQQRGREWDRFNASVPVVRDVCSLSVPMAKTTTQNHKLTSFTVTGQDGLLPSAYQHTHTTDSLNLSYDRKQSDTSDRPITRQRRGSEPVTNKVKVDDIILLDLPTTAPVSQSERATNVSHLLSPPNSSTSRLPQRTLLSAQEQSSIPDVSSLFVPGPSEVPHPCFYAPPTLHPHLGKVSYVHNLLRSIQTQAQSAQPSPIHHLHTTSENHNSSKSSDQLIMTCRPHQIKTTGAQEGHGVTVTAATQQHHQQLFVYGAQSFLPAHVCGNFLTGSHGGVFNGTAPCHVTTDPKSRRCFYVNPLPQFQSKMLLDPETGQFIQVFLPAASSSLCSSNPVPTVMNPSPAVLKVGSINTTPTMLQVGGADPRVMSVVQLQPAVAMSSLYAPITLPFTLHMPPV